MGPCVSVLDFTSLHFEVTVSFWKNFIKLTAAHWQNSLPWAGVSSLSPEEREPGCAEGPRAWTGCLGRRLLAPASCVSQAISKVGSCFCL